MGKEGLISVCSANMTPYLRLGMHVVITCKAPVFLHLQQQLRHSGIEGNYTITVYGTPAEESVSGKIMMIKGGCTFEELDVALMMHGEITRRRMSNPWRCLNSEWNIREPAPMLRLNQKQDEAR
ncbi:MAG: hypothetical protein ACLTBV_19925 [Enterocloster bolteae]